MPIEITCGYCDERSVCATGHVNRVRKNGGTIYCGRRCAGLGRRKNKSTDKCKEEKRLYDAAYKIKNRSMLKAKKASYFQKTYDPELAAVKRESVKKERPEIEARRREYMASPEYVAAKKKYDQEYRAKKTWGEYWESGILAIEINNEVKSRASDMEIRVQNETLNKKLTRRRYYEKLKRNKLEAGPLGNLERNQG